MKRIILTGILLYGMTAVAQNNQGTITYEEVVSLDIQLEGDMAAFASMMPKERKLKRILYYQPGGTLYKAVKSEPNENRMSSNGMNIVVETNEPDDIIYKDLEAHKTYEQKDFMGRKFLITSEQNKLNWKMTGQQKELLGYPCQEATTIKDKDTITAWFTPALPVPSGPRSLGMLPGMILEAQINSQFHITATEVHPGTVDKSVFAKPKGGKKVSAEEFAKIVAEKTKEMQEQYGGKGNNIIMMKVSTDR